MDSLDHALSAIYIHMQGGFGIKAADPQHDGGDILVLKYVL